MRRIRRLDKYLVVAGLALLLVYVTGYWWLFVDPCVAPESATTLKKFEAWDSHDQYGYGTFSAHGDRYVEADSRGHHWTRGIIGGECDGEGYRAYLFDDQGSLVDFTENYVSDSEYALKWHVSNDGVSLSRNEVVQFSKGEWRGQ